MHSTEEDDAVEAWSKYTMEQIKNATGRPFKIETKDIVNSMVTEEQDTNAMTIKNKEYAELLNIEDYATMNSNIRDLENIIQSNLDTDKLMCFTDADISTSLVDVECGRMIVQNDNAIEGNVYEAYTALSYVSNGSRIDNIKEGSDITALLIQLNNSKGKKKTCMSRCSNDRIKYLFAMNAMPNVLLWTDQISMMRNYDNTEELMRAIGNGYKLSERTVVILEREDAIMLKNVANMVMQLNIDMLRLTTHQVDIDKIVSNMSDYKENLRQMMYNKSEFSYWSRVWTLQELHLSNRVDYRTIYDFQIKHILSSGDIMTVMELFSQVVSVWRDEVINSGNKAFEFMTLLGSFLTGYEKRRLCEHKNSVYPSKSMDRILLEELVINVRYARDRKEALRAINIALGAFGAGDVVGWKVILSKFIDNDFMPCHNSFGGKRYVYDWAPGEHIESALPDGKKESYSTAYLSQFTHISNDTNVRLVRNPGGSLVIKATLIKTKIREIKKYEKPYYERVGKNKLLINNVDWNKYDVKAEVTKMGKTLEVDAVLQYEGDIPEDILLLVSTNGVHAVVNGDKNRICGVLEMRLDEQGDMWYESMKEPKSYFLIK